jgi:hypothetical protein
LEWYKKNNLLKEAQLSWYQTIDKKHLSVYVKFDDGLSIPFARKQRSKKWDFFQADGPSLFKMRGLKNNIIHTPPTSPQNSGYTLPPTSIKPPLRKCFRLGRLSKTNGQRFHVLLEGYH